jgi:hypothetical protein
MTHTGSGINQNQIQKSLVPMLRTWAHSIGWTVLLSAALAILFSMVCDGCAGIHLAPQQPEMLVDGPVLDQ